MEINENNLKQLIELIVKEELNKYSKKLVLEYALERGVYKFRLENELPQIIENWCLVHFCTLTNRDETKIHWKGELRGHFLNATNLNLTKNNKEDKRRKVLDEIWNDYDYNLSVTISTAIANKFIKENINIKSDVFKQVVDDFIQSSEEIKNVILSKNIDLIADYVEKI